MLILSLDTTTKTASCALARDGVVLHESTGDGSGAHAARLPGDLQQLLADAGVSLAQIDLFATATGPGSFTGLRIGIATMQGLAFATGMPLIGVSGFAALALIAGHDGPRRIATWGDAWRGEVYAALYEDGVEVEAPVVAAPELLLAGLAGRPTLFIGDGAATCRERIVAVMGEHARIVGPPTPPIAGAIARLATDVARELIARGEALPEPHAIRPLYVRRADVELTRDRPV